MDFFQGPANAFQPSTSLPYNIPPSPYANGESTFPVNADYANISPPQQWQAPLGNNHPMWHHSVPNVMPWSSSGPCAFSQPLQQPFEQPIQPNMPFQNVAYFPSASFHQPPFMPSQSMPISPLPGASAGITSPSTSPPFQGNFNQNNKRQVSPLDIEVDANFDFESRRPVKKYISEDKVLEIFDQFGRFHIREGEQYIVEDEPLRKTSNNFKHNVKIEVLEDEEDHVLELSPELKNAFQNGNSSIAGKLIQEEKDKISKAVVLWQPNTILKTLLSDDDSKSESEDEANEGVEIEEIFSDQDEEMLNIESEIEQTNREEDNFELME